MRYRKKPVEVEAFKFDGNLMDPNGNYYVPDWAIKAFKKGNMYFGNGAFNRPPYGLFINTLEGTHHVSVGDYVIKGIKGELYPCKPDIFTDTYEEVN